MAVVAVVQLLFLAGLSTTVGFKRTVKFFTKSGGGRGGGGSNVKGSAAFFGGFVLVLWGWPLIGMICEG